MLLNPAQLRFLRAQAHALKPVVMIGESGLSDAIVKEAERSLARHELIKIKTRGDNRDLRKQQLEELCARLEAAPVQHLGKMLVIYKPAKKPKLVLPQGTSE